MINVIHKDLQGNKIGESDFTNQAAIDAHKISNPEMWEPSCITESVDKTAQNAQSNINSDSKKYLAETDWYVIRKSETNVEIPAEVISLRAAARLAIIQ